MNLPQRSPFCCHSDATACSKFTRAMLGTCMSSHLTGADRRCCSCRGDYNTPSSVTFPSQSRQASSNGTIAEVKRRLCSPVALISLPYARLALLPLARDLGLPWLFGLSRPPGAVPACSGMPTSYTSDEPEPWEEVTRVPWPQLFTNFSTV